MKFGVSLYSYQWLFMDGKIQFEDMLRAVAELPNADGVEVLGKTTPPTTYPDIQPGELEVWRDMLAKYNLKPVCYDSCSHDFVGDAAAREAFMKREIDYASATGFPMVRNEIYELDVVEKCLGYAQDKNVIINLEVSHLMQLDGEQVTSYLEMIDRTGTKYAGIMPDMSIFQCALPFRVVQGALEAGADEKELRLVQEAFAAGQNARQVIADLRAKGGGAGMEEPYNYLGYSAPSQLQKLEPVGKYITHFHSKFHYMGADRKDPCHQYEEVLQLLQKMGYAGYVCSEYEGTRMWPESQRPDPIEQVRRQHAMFRDILG